MPTVTHKPQKGTQEDFLSTSVEECFIGGEAGGGKALCRETPIPSPDGWVRMADIKKGDKVYDENGDVRNVMWVSNTRRNRPCYKFTFSDGSKLVADEEHLWLTLTYKERCRNRMRSDGFRKRRREKRPLRGTGAKPWVARRNKEMTHDYIEPIDGVVRTTKEIFDTQKTKCQRKANNHSIKVCKPIDGHWRRLPIGPYTLGVWLGDGNNRDGYFTTADKDVVAGIKEDLYVVTKNKNKLLYNVVGLASQLRKEKLLHNKHIPQIYLRASYKRRVEVLRGLMDTDGYVKPNGLCEYTTTSKRLKDDVLDLILGLGIKAVAREGNATLNGRYISKKWRIVFCAGFPLFKIKRKLKKQKMGGLRETTQNRYIVDVKRVKTRPVKCISVDSPSHCYLAGKTYIPTHNSWGCLQDFLYDVDNPKSNGIFFRRSYPDLEDIMHKAQEHYAGFGAQWKAAQHMFVFPSGARFKFAHMQNIQAVYTYIGQEYTHGYWDELPQFPLLPYQLMISRYRTTDQKLKPRIRCTGNPDGEGVLWVKARFIDMLKPYEIGWFKTVNDRDTRATKEQEKRLFSMVDMTRNERAKIFEHRPDLKGYMSRQWMPTHRAENVALMDADPEYEARLDQLPEEMKQKYKYGVWTSFDRKYQLIKTQWLQNALNGRNDVKAGIAAVGADYAETGDLCVTCSGRGNQVQKITDYPGMKTPEFATIIHQEHMRYGMNQCIIGVDANGPGVGVYHALGELGLDDKTEPCMYKDPHFDSKFEKLAVKLKFNNWRSQAAWQLREDFANGNIDLKMLQGKDGYYANLHLLQEEILAHEFKNENGLIKIIGKNDLRKPDKLGRSPDRFDALMIWNWMRNREEPIAEVKEKETEDYCYHSKTIREASYDYKEATPWT